MLYLHCVPVDAPPIRDMFCALGGSKAAVYFLEIHMLTLSTFYTYILYLFSILFTLYTLHFTLYTLHLTLYTLIFNLQFDTIHYTLYIILFN